MAQALKIALHDSITHATLRRVWEITGLWPFNPERFLTTLPPRKESSAPTKGKVPSIGGKILTTPAIFREINDYDLLQAKKNRKQDAAKKLISRMIDYDDDFETEDCEDVVGDRGEQNEKEREDEKIGIEKESDDPNIGDSEFSGENSDVLEDEKRFLDHVFSAVRNDIEETTDAGADDESIRESVEDESEMSDPTAQQVQRKMKMKKKERKKCGMRKQDDELELWDSTDSGVEFHFADEEGDANDITKEKPTSIAAPLKDEEIGDHTNVQEFPF